MMNESQAQELAQIALDFCAPEMGVEITDAIDFHETCVGQDGNPLIVFTTRDGVDAEPLKNFFKESAHVPFGDGLQQIDFDVLSPGGMH